MRNGNTDSLLQDALDAHGGLTRWTALRQVRGRIISGGLLYDLKGQAQDRTPRQMTVALRRVATQLQPFGAPDQRMIFTPERTVIEKLDGTTVARAGDLRNSFTGHTLTTVWEPLQRAYFSGYALWTYLNCPFLLTLPGVQLYPLESVDHEGRRLDGIGALLPPHLPTHSRRQQFYFGPDRLLRRHDYRVDIAGAFPASQYLDDFVDAEGITVPLTRRAYRSDEHGATLWDQLMVSMQFSDMQFSQERFCPFVGGSADTAIEAHSADSASSGPHKGDRHSLPNVDGK
jgi:hypothetical protein